MIATNLLTSLSMLKLLELVVLLVGACIIIAGSMSELVIPPFWGDRNLLLASKASLEMLLGRGEALQIREQRLARCSDYEMLASWQPAWRAG